MSGPLIYLTRGMHRGGASALRDIDWVERRWDASETYLDDKLSVTALAFAVAGAGRTSEQRRRPGWVPTKMGGAGVTTIPRRAIGPDMARSQRWSRGDRQRPLLAPSQSEGRGERSVQPPLSGSASANLAELDGRVSL